MRIAIVRLSALGDIINSAPILSFIKSQYPDAQIEWICEEAFAPIIQGHPHLHKVHTVAIKRAKKNKSIPLLLETIKKLRSLGKFNLIIDLQGLLKSALVARFIGKNVHGFAKDSIRESLASVFYHNHTHIPYEENSIWRSIALVNDALQLSITPEDLNTKVPSLNYETKDFHFQELLDFKKKNIAFVLGASWPSKAYPEENFVALAKLFDANILLIWGSDAEKAKAQSIQEQTSNTRLAPKLSLNELVAFIDHMDLTIGNDTGPTHIAWAMNKASITLFGPTPADKMMWQGPQHIAIESSSKVNPLKLNREDDSIKEISPDLIYEKAKTLL
jgi:heptosyltransferase-1